MYVIVISILCVSCSGANDHSAGEIAEAIYRVENVAHDYEVRNYSNTNIPYHKLIIYGKDSLIPCLQVMVSEDVEGDYDDIRRKWAQAAFIRIIFEKYGYSPNLYGPEYKGFPSKKAYVAAKDIMAELGMIEVKMDSKQKILILKRWISWLSEGGYDNIPKYSSEK
jgi:hypothetical protein